MRQRSARLENLAISPIDEAFKSVVGQGGDEILPPTHRTLYLAHEIDEDLALAFTASLQRLVDEDTTDPIHLVINCPGGDDVCGFGMYDAVAAAAKLVPVNATVYGGAMSMMAIILQAATTRQMGENSYLMVHQSWGTLFGHSTVQFERQTRWLREMENRATRLLVARSTLEADELSKKIEAGDWYLNARQALKYGFVDELI